MLFVYLVSRCEGAVGKSTTFDKIRFLEEAKTKVIYFTDIFSFQVFIRDE